ADTLYRADMPNAFFGPRHRYYLRARSALGGAEVTEMLLREGKRAPADGVEPTVSRALPGIELMPLQTLPLGMPRRSGAAYFRVESQSGLWDEVMADGRLMLFLPNPPAELRLELIVIKG